MPTSSPSLLEPYLLRDLTLCNRVVMAPLTRGRAGRERIPNTLMGKYYVQRASAGLIISEATTISQQANGWNESPGMYTDEMEQGWLPIVDQVHQAGGKMFLQLWHCGRASHSSFHDGKPAVAASPIKLGGEYIHTPKGKETYEVPRALKTAEIAEVVMDYQMAARRARRAGFDGVEIHAANGYLLDTFLQSRTNQRTDQYGGSIENRYRILGEVVAGVQQEWPSDRIGVRLSPNGNFNDMGSPDFREQFLFVAEQLNSYGLGYLHVMDGLAFGFHELGKPLTLGDFRQVFDGPLMGNCGYDQKSAETAIATGLADLIAFGRPFISNPDLVHRFEHDLPLNAEAEMSTWYGPLGEKGYTDFPFASV